MTLFSSPPFMQVDFTISVDFGGQVCRIEQNGRIYEIYDPMNVGNAVYGTARVKQMVKEDAK